MNTTEDLKFIQDQFRGCIGPQYQGAECVKLECCCAFEGNGRASETWEYHWRLILPLCKAYYEVSKGEWRRCNDCGLGIMVFVGEKVDDVIRKATEFLTAVPDFEKCDPSIRK